MHTFVFEDIVNIKETKFTYKTIDYNAGFIKLYDEILTNASDHYIRTGQVKYIKIYVEKDKISVENDGPGIPITIHRVIITGLEANTSYEYIAGEEGKWSDVAIFTNKVYNKDNGDHIRFLWSTDQQG